MGAVSWFFSGPQPSQGAAASGGHKSSSSKSATKGIKTAYNKNALLIMSICLALGLGAAIDNNGMQLDARILGNAVRCAANFLYLVADGIDKIVAAAIWIVNWLMQNKEISGFF